MSLPHTAPLDVLADMIGWHTPEMYNVMTTVDPHSIMHAFTGMFAAWAREAGFRSDDHTWHGNYLPLGYVSEFKQFLNNKQPWVLK